MTIGRASQYVDQLEAHMDEGGKTAPNNVRDLIQTVRELVSANVILGADLYNARQQHVTICGRCDKPIAQQHEVFRCTGCKLPMHHECAVAHFAESVICGEYGEGTKK